MKKNLNKIVLFIFILQLFYFNLAKSDKLQFHPEAMVSDFNGVIYNGINVLCYGENGIITLSIDRGSSWTQINIGYKYNIKKLLNIGTDIYGITDFSLIKSIDNGLTWQNVEISKYPIVKDLFIEDNFLFILTNNSILKSDLNLEIMSNPIIQLDENENYVEMKMKNDSIYLLSNNEIDSQKHILIFDINSLSKERIDLEFKFSTKYEIIGISNLYITEKNIFFVVQFYTYGSTKKIKSEFYRMEKNIHKRVLLHIWDNNSYYFDNNTLFNVSLRLSNNNNAFGLISLFKISDDIDTGNVFISQAITDSNQLPEGYINFDSYLINKMIKFGNDTIICVGKKKLIATSFDGGKSFKLRSLFQVFNITFSFIETNYDFPYIVNKKIFYHRNRCRTIDGGITWQSPLGSFNPELNTNVNTFSFYNQTGEGLAIINTTNKASILTTSDTGRTYKLTDFEDVNLIKSASNTKGFKFGDSIVFTFITRSFYFDKKFNYINYSFNDSLPRQRIIQDDQDIFYSYTYLESGANKKELSKIAIIRSDDYCRTWKVISDTMVNSNIPLSKVYYKLYFNDIFAYKDYIILIPVTLNKLYMFNKKSHKLDSLDLPFEILEFNTNKFVLFQNKLFILGNNHAYIYYTDDLNFNYTKWDSIRIDSLLPTWQKYNKLQPTANESFLHSFQTSDDQLYLIINNIKKSSDNVLNAQENIIRLFKDNTTSIDENIETEQVYLWNNYPIPTPATSSVSFELYYNSYYNIENAHFKVFDLYGVEIINPILTISPSNKYSANVTWDCSKYSNGIYFIQVDLGAESKTVKVLISR